MVKQSLSSEQNISPLLEVQNVTFGYADKPLLYNVSLQVREE